MPNNFQPHIPDFQRGERLSAARLNELADAIARLLWHKQQSANATFGVRSPLEIIGKLDDDLPAATSFATTPGEAVMTVWIKDTATGDLIETDRKENVKQRFESADAKSAGDEIRAAWIEGEWVALPSGGGGGHTIWFEIADVLCPETDYVEETTLVVTATYYNLGCNKTPPGANYDGTYDVFDICSYLSGIDATSLIGTVGRASYMYPLNSSYCEPRWIIDDICAAPHC